MTYFCFLCVDKSREYTQLHSVRVHIQSKHPDRKDAIYYNVGVRK